MCSGTTRWVDLCKNHALKGMPMWHINTATILTSTPHSSTFSKMPASTAHESACRYICLSGLARVVDDSRLLNEKKPYNWNMLCEWQLAKEDPLTMVAGYYSPSGPVESGSVVHVSGELKFMPGDSEGKVDASCFHEVVPAKNAGLADLSPPVVCAVGIINTTIGRDWSLSVATYDHVARTHKTFTITVQVPPTGRFSNLRNPAKGTIISVRGILSSITTEEVAAIDLEAVTFISISNADRPAIMSAGASSSASASSLASPAQGEPRTVGRTKCERRQGQEGLTLSKKIHIGPPSMFLNPAELAEFTGESTQGSEEPLEPSPSESVPA
ncbi:hypothetical protein FRC10_003238 [Ceratobasidium sp. 414]|nr:hypothetical protein FRC10_003238 [Ceratobasidium sp. 414]